MRLSTFIVVLTFFAQAPAGVFETELWPGEGRPEFQAVTNELAIRERPLTSARIEQRLRASKGQQIAFDETRFRTIEAGRLQVLAYTSVTGRLLGTIRHLTRDAYEKQHFPGVAIACKQGDVIEYLQYRAEGTCFVRVGEEVVDAGPCPAQDDQRFRVLTQPKVEWWIRVVLDRAPIGWVMVDEKTVKKSGRSF